MINNKSTLSYVLVLLILSLIGLSGVSASDYDNSMPNLNSTDNQITFEENLISLDYSNYEKSDSNVIHITEENYFDYFDFEGNLNDSLVLINDTIDLSGNFNNKSFIFNMPLKITSVNKDAYLYDCQIGFINVSIDLKSTVSNLNMDSSVTNRVLILIHNSQNVFVLDNILKSSGYHSYPIALDGSNYTYVLNNTIKTTVSNRESKILDDLDNSNNSDNSSWQHSGITLMNSHYNIIGANNITVEDSYGIYFCYPLSNYNIVSNNVIKSSIDHPSFWAYGIYITGSYNSISNNTIDGMYRGVSVTKPYNNITDNKIYNITGEDLLNSELKGGDYAIYTSANTLIANNSIYNSNVFGAGIIVSYNCEVYGNYIEIITNKTGIKIGGEEEGSNSKVFNNTIRFFSGYGILVEGEPKNVYIGFNKLFSFNDYINLDRDIGISIGMGIGIYVKYQSRSKRPYNLTVEYNYISTSSNVAIDLSQASLDLYYCDNNNVSGKEIIYPNSAEYNPIKSNGAVYYVTPNNFESFFDYEGILSSIIDDYDTLIFTGNFAPKSHKLIISKLLNIVGNSATFINTTFCVYVSGCKIENITIINNGTLNQNLWGIYVYEADNVSLIGNNITVWDKNTSYAIYLCDSVGSTIINNNLKAQGDELVFTLLSYEVHNSYFENNSIFAIGTGILHPYIETICFDGVHLISELSKTYGVIFDFSSNNQFIHNSINVTSLVEGFQIPYNPSVNILIGIYLYYDSDYNNISENNVWVEGHDPFLYGIGCSGDDTSKSVTTADYNTFKSNNVTVKGDYFSTGIILRHNSLNTLLDNNSINLNATNYTYGITLEISGFSKVVNNKLNSSAHGNYGIELYSSWSNDIDSNVIYSDASFTESVGAYGSSGNNFTNNMMISYGNSKFDPAQGPEHPDKVVLKNVAMWFDSHSSGNRIVGNSIYTDAPYGIEFAGGSSGNYIGSNNIYAGKSYGNSAILDNVGGNVVSNNKGQIFNSNGSSSESNAILSDDSNLNGASSNGAIDYGLQPNSLSSADLGSGNAGSRGVASELNQVASNSLSSQYVVPLIILFIIALFCYSFLSDKKDEE